MQVQVVAPNLVYQIWGQVEPFFKASELVSTDDCTTDQLKLQLVSGAQTLLVAVKDNEIKGAASLTVSSLPNHRVAQITAMGGRGIVGEEAFNQVVAWAKSQGATKIRAWAREPQARLYRLKVGLNTTTHVVEKLI